MKTPKRSSLASACELSAMLSLVLAVPAVAQVPTADFFYEFDTNVNNSGTGGYNLFLRATTSLSSFAPVSGQGSLFIDASAATNQFVEGLYGNNPNLTFADDRRTIAFWMRAAPTQTYGSATMFSQGFSTVNGARFDLRLDAGKLRLEIGGGFQRVESQTLTDDCWHHIAVVVPFEESTMEDIVIYIDGEVQTDIEFGGNEADPINTVDPRFIWGDSNFANRDFDGYLDAAGVWLLPLNATEVAEVYGDPVVVAYDSELDLVSSGDPVTITIQFDPAAETATLDDGTTVTDLIAEDVDGDGKVELTFNPTSSATYDLSVTRGADTEARSLVISVVEIPAPTPYSTLVLDDGAIAYYRFEETPGSPGIFDASGNGFHSTGFIGTPATGVDGAIGTAVLFDGNSSIATQLNYDPSVNANGDGGFSIEMIIRRNGDIEAAEVFIAQQNGTGTGRTFININGNAEITSFLGGQTALSTAVLPADTWCHVVFVYDAVIDQVRFYVDGQPAGSTSGPIAELATGNWIFGSNKDQTTQLLDGLMDEVSIYDSLLDDPNNDGTLDDSKVLSHYEAYLAEAKPLLGFSADVVSVNSGDTVTLTWKTSDLADSVSISGLAPLPGASGGGTFTQIVNPTETTTYTITVVDGSETYEQTVTVVVNVPAEAFVLEPLGFNEGSFEFLAKVPLTGVSYTLTRGTDLLDFGTVVTTFTPTELETPISDPAPPEGKAFYRLEETEP